MKQICLWHGEDYGENGKLNSEWPQQRAQKWGVVGVLKRGFSGSIIKVG